MDIEILKETLNNLSKEKKFFFSEADFEFSFVWKLHERKRDYKISLEYPQIIEKETQETYYLDMMVEDELGLKYAFEFKYKTLKIKDEQVINKFNNINLLKNQSANDLARYGFYKDIKRIETLIESKKIQKGFCIFLTNDSKYWNKTPYSESSCDSEFGFYKENKIIEKGIHKYNENGSDKMKKTCKDITLKNQYDIEWNEYSNIGNSINCLFQYLLIEIK